ncbi:S24/S26 family peptidase [Nocardia sp. NPDC050697]|uniref:S24/S26 family peptidase n=1 Tax=Nocardia sp. NPDC050697 TaxID=3155158 RepID=UPI0033DFCD3D
MAGTFCLIAAAAALLFGIKPLLFRSGSMEPEIGPGAVALVRTVDATGIEPGDVVSVRNAAGERLTHRVVAVDSITGNSATFRMKGDANESEDAQPYTVTEAERVFVHVEKLGYAVAWLASPPAVFLGGAFAGLLLAIAFLPRPVRPAPGGGGKHAAAPLLVVAALVTATGLAGAPEAQAATTDAAAANSGAFTSRTEFVPRINQTFGNGAYVTCSKQSATGPDPVTLTWRHLGAPYRYRLVLRDLSGTVWRTWEVTTVPATAGGTVSFVITGAGLPGRLVAWQYDLEVHTVLPGPPTSSGAASTAWRGIGVVQNILGALVSPEDLDCGVLRGEQNGAPAYVPGPASVACTTAAPRATLTWPHLGSPYTYQLIVRDGTSRNIMLTRQVTTVPAQAGQSVTSTIAVADLDLTQRTGDAAVAEIRTLSGTATSTEFAQQNLTVTTTAVACPVAGLRAQSAPASGTTTTATTTSATAPTSAPATTTAPSTAPPPAAVTTTTTPASEPPAPAPTTTTTTPPPAPRELPPTTTPSSTTTTPP